MRVAIDTPDQAVRLSFKTEAREKWRVLIDEGRTGHVYLVTMGEDLTADKIPEMAVSKIVVFVPAHIKDSDPAFREATSIRTLDDLPKNLRRVLYLGIWPLEYKDVLIGHRIAELSRNIAGRVSEGHDLVRDATHDSLLVN